MIYCMFVQTCRQSFKKRHPLKHSNTHKKFEQPTQKPETIVRWQCERRKFVVRENWVGGIKICEK